MIRCGVLCLCVWSADMKWIYTTVSLATFPIECLTKHTLCTAISFNESIYVVHPVCVYTQVPEPIPHSLALTHTHTCTA